VGVTRLEIFGNTTTALKGKKSFEFHNTKGIYELARRLIASEEGPYSTKFFNLCDRKGMICRDDYN
jgi:hypothetical protein